MNNIESIINAMYSSYLARDFFAKVVPGTIVLLAIITWLPVLPMGIIFLSNLPWLAWIFVYGLCFIVGFIIQAVGERIGLVRAYPRDEKEEEARKRWVKFLSLENISRRIREERERLVVIKEMSGNSFLSFTISLIIYIVATIINRNMPTWPQIFLAVLTVISTVALYWYQCVMRRRQRDVEIQVIGITRENGG